MKDITLRNGMKLPWIGLGTWQITDRTLMREIIAGAAANGYRLIDTAAAYSNEIAIAKAIEAEGISRKDIILSDKVWNSSRGFSEVQNACRRSLKKIKTDYFHLYMVHWPASVKLHQDWREINAETWRGMEQLYQDGIVRAIGVCNFKRHHLEELRKTAKIMPFVNQIELHPGFEQKEIVNYCKSREIAVEGSSPLGNGQILSNPQLSEIANVYGKSTAQICLRWIIQKGAAAIPKTQSTERLRANMDVFDFELSEEYMKAIDDIPYCGGIGIDPDEVTEFG